MFKTGTTTTLLVFYYLWQKHVQEMYTFYWNSKISFQQLYPLEAATLSRKSKQVLQNPKHRRETVDNP